MDTLSDNDLSALDPTLSIIPPRADLDPTRPQLGILAQWTVSQSTLPRLPHDATESSEAIDATESSGAMLGMAVTPPLPGPRGPAQYIFERRIGRGGMGEVWEAVQESLGRKVAVKRIRPRDEKGTITPRQEYEFRTEAMIAGLLEHPNIVPVHDLGRGDDGSPLMCMKLVSGRSWDKVLREDFPVLDQDDFLGRHLPILRGMSQAVAFAHTRGIVHRDLKPGQVMVGDFGEVMLMDWGLALRLQSSMDHSGSGSSRDSAQILPSPATASNPAGTPALMAPEQTLDHAHEVDTWTDVYLLGATLYYLLTGTYPHEAGTSVRAMMIAAKGLIIPPEKRTPGRNHPEALVRICLKAMKNDPRERHKDGSEFLSALDDYLSGSEKRARAREIVRLVEELMAPAEANYADFARALTMLEEALRLWPDHPHAQALRWTVTERYARQALRQGDLMLTRLHAESLPPGPLRDALLAEVEAALRSIRRRELLIRHGAISIAVLMLIIALGFAYFSRNLALANSELSVQTQEAVRQRESAERNLVIAKEQGDGAFNVVLFVLDKLRDAMAKELTVDRGIPEPVANDIKHAIAGEIASPAVKYLEDMDIDKWPENLQVIHAKRMRLVGNKFRDMGRFKESLGLLEGAVRIGEKRLKHGDISIGTFLADLGTVQTRLGDLEGAQKSLTRSAKIHEDSLGPSNKETLTVLSNLGGLYADMGHLKEAESIFKQVLEAREKVFGPESLEAAMSLNNLAGLYDRQFFYAKAEPLYRRALGIFEKASNPESDTLATALANLGNSCVYLRRFDEAEPLLLRALAIREKELGRNHPSTALSMNSLAVLYLRQGRLEEAVPMAERVIELRKAIYGMRHASTATAIHNLGYIYAEQGKYQEAEELMREAVDISIAAVGWENPVTTGFLYNLGILLKNTGGFDEGDMLLSYCTSVQEEKFGVKSTQALSYRRSLFEHRIAWMRSLVAKGDLEQARSVAVRAINAFTGLHRIPNHLSWYADRAEAYLLVGNRDEALGDIQWLETKCYPDEAENVTEEDKVSYRVLREELGLPAVP